MTGDSLLRAIETARARVPYLGRMAAVATVLLESAPRLTQKAEILLGRPSLHEIRQWGNFMETAHDVLKEIVPFDDKDWDRYEAEFLLVEKKLKERRTVQLAYPDTFAVERETSLLLYCTTRLLQPQCIVETGVADGASSFVFLEALRANGSGTLHSLDISDNVGALVDNRDGWDLTICNVKRVESALSALIGRIAPVELFFHDADHRFLPQLCEYETFAAHAPPGAILLSDDVDSSYAFRVFCERRRFQPSYLFDTRKVAGLVRL